MANRQLQVIIAVSVIGFVSGLAFADSLPASTTRHHISALLQNGLEAIKSEQWTRALAAAEEAVHLIRKQAPLEIRKASVVHHNHTGIGLYSPAPGAEVHGQELKLYVEVANFENKKIGPELYEVQLEVQGEFKLEDQTPLGSRDLGLHRYKTRSPSGVTSFGLDVTLGKSAPKGVYFLRLHVKDRLGNKEADYDLTFRIP